MGPSEVRTRPEELEDLLDDWRRLAAGIADSSYFLSPDWVLGWWETLGAGSAAEVAVWRGPSGALEAVLPVARVAQRLRGLRVKTPPPVVESSRVRLVSAPKKANRASMDSLRKLAFS